MTVLLHIAAAFVLSFLLGRWRTVTPRDPQQPAQTPPILVTTGLTVAVQQTFSAGEGALQLWLVASGPNKINTIKVVRKLTQLGLKDAKDLCGRAPTPLCQVRTQADAEIIQRMFTGVAPVEFR